ncbi:TonB-dependent receptor plug domain-containing protein [Sphingomonas sp. GM_Shp_1]|uniref:TonB-dependent receptor plug domain-containing protein n=1 Tax=Sphingomonas sp. GM_Shp_1 TaxID=2937381 RepID=UPI00226B7398|nr:TonB-dependent receptor plug domain-containing protein [Sphingomonas sp. GM_Shp_1]
MRIQQSASWLALSAASMMLAAPAIAQQVGSTATQDEGSDSRDRDTTLSADAAATRSAAITGTPQASSGGEVIVTGTRITRPNLASAAPITSVTRQDIQAQAPLNVEEVLNRLPQVAPDAQSNYADSDGRQRIKLRSLGFERTLVLVDGKRLGTQNGQDTGIIPATLLERVDVLSGGASSVYGSDAISGVVNFVLRKDFEGLRLDGNYNFYNHNNTSNIVTPIATAAGFSSPRGLTNDGGRADLTLTAGKKLFDGRLNVSGFVNYRQADLVQNGARSYAACPIAQLTKDSALSCSPLSTYSPSGFVSPVSGPNANAQYVNNPDGSRTFVPWGPGAGNAANPYDDVSFQRANERYTAGGFVNFKISPEVEIYGDGIWFRDTSENPTPRRVYSYTVAGTTPYQVNCDNPFLSGGQAGALGCAPGSTGFVPLDVRYRFDGQPAQADRFVNMGFRATGGVRGKVGEAWSYDIGGVYARNQQEWYLGPTSQNDRVNRSLNVVNVNGVATCRSVIDGSDPNCIPFDAFRAGSGSNALTNYLFTSGATGLRRQVTQLFDAIAVVNGDLTTYGIKTPWADDGLAVSLGTEYRKDRLISEADAGFVAQFGNQDARLSQDVWESNIELQAPLVQNKPFAHLLQTNGGFRVSKYSSNPKTFSTWKIEGLYAPVADITFRASYNKAQRAPTVIEIRQATQINYGRNTTLTDFCAPVSRTLPDGTVTTTPLGSRELCSKTGLADNLYGSTSLLCPTEGCTTRSGGFTADPETAYTLTFGLVVKPSFIPGLVFSADRYQVRIVNSLGYNGADYYLQGCLASNGDPFFCNGIVRDPTTGSIGNAPAGNPTAGFVRQGTTNYYRTLANGWDFQGQYSLDLNGAGRLDWGFNGSLSTLAGGQDSPLRLQYNCAGYFSNGISCGQLVPKWAHTLRTTWTTPDRTFNASFNWRYTGSLTTANNSGNPDIGGTPERFQNTFARIAPQSYFDLALTWNVARKFAFRIIANNLFDKTPPIIPNSYQVALSRTNTAPQRYDALGRQIAIGTTINF